MSVSEVAPLHAILPLAEVERCFDKPVRLEQLGIDRLGEVVARDPNALLNTAFTVWQRYVARQPAADPEAVRAHIRRHGGSFLEAAQAVLGEPVIKDLSFSRCVLEDPTLEDHLAAYLIVARVYPNDVHIADMNFANPYKPIPPERRGFKFRRYKGLSLLGMVLGRIEAYARGQGCDYLTLTAAADDLVPLFAKHGFRVEDGNATSLAMEKRVGGGVGG